MASEPGQIVLTQAARVVPDLANDCGLRPHAEPDEPGGYGRGPAAG